jgi:hypothetical protein
MSQDTNEVETACSYCRLTINPGRGVHGIGRKSNVWLHHLCKMSSDRSELRYLRSHGIETNQDSRRRSRRKSPALTESDGSDEEIDQSRTSHPMALTEAEELLSLIYSESSLKVTIHRIGNGEFVLIVEGYFYIWSAEDWDQLPEKTDEASTDTEAKVPELVY